MNEVDYRMFEEAHFVDILERVRRRIEDCGLSVSTGTLPPSSAADFDGLSIVLQETMTPDAALFNLLHIFGHTVQWCTNPETLILARRKIVPGRPLPEHELLAIKVYEQEASEYGIQLLHEIGVYDLDQWVSDVWGWDWDYLEGVYVRNAPAQPALSYDYHQIPFGRSLLRSKPVPEFTPRRFETRRVI